MSHRDEYDDSIDFDYADLDEIPFGNLPLIPSYRRQRPDPFKDVPVHRPADGVLVPDGKTFCDPSPMGTVEGKR